MAFMSESLRQWFGDSKVVDADGKPLVVYHGTADEFDHFIPSVYGGVQGGLFFTHDEQIAAQFALSAQESTDNDGRVLAVHLSICCPKRIDAADIMDGPAHSFAREFAAVAAARAEGYDGLFIGNVPEHDGRRADQWVALDPAQVRIIAVTLVDALAWDSRASAYQP
jgi:hypothetical protein